MNFHQLYVFYTVARCQGFSRAAHVLDISQPAVSIQVQELERSLGISLFHRRSKGLELTAVGKTVYNYAHRLFSLATEMEGVLQDIQGLRQGRLTLGASTTPGEFILPLAIGKFRKLYPGVQVELIISNTRSIVDRILQRELDVGMIGTALETDSGELETSTYVMDEIVLVVSPNHPLALKEIVSLQEVMEEGLVVREEGSATRKTTEEYFLRHGVVPRIAIELGSNQAVKQMVAAGFGVGVISRYGIFAEVKAEILQVLEIEGWSCTRPLTLVYIKERHLSPAQRAFLQLLERERPLPPVL